MNKEDDEGWIDEEEEQASFGKQQNSKRLPFLFKIIFIFFPKGEVPELMERPNTNLSQIKLNVSKMLNSNDLNRGSKIFRKETRPAEIKRKKGGGYK